MKNLLMLVVLVLLVLTSAVGLRSLTAYQPVQTVSTGMPVPILPDTVASTGMPVPILPDN